jgi:hypothetical protein
MSDPAYPYPVLPRPTQNYGSTTDPHLAVTQFEIGRRQRPKFSAVDEVISVSWDMTQLQLDTFRYFVANILKQGSLAFTIGIVGLDGIQTRTVQLVGGTFTERYVPHQRYTVSASLLAVTPTQMDEEMFEALQMVELSDLDGFVALCLGLYLYIEYNYGTGTI